MEPKNKPEKHIKFGGVRVSIWKDVRKNAGGGAFESRSVTLDRAYKDGNGQWQNTGSLRENDVPKAVAALQKAFEYMNERNDNEEGE
jgi:hypothetical protein